MAILLLPAIAQNPEVVAFVNNHIGQRVGNGQCGTLIWKAKGDGVLKKIKTPPKAGDVIEFLDANYKGSGGENWSAVRHFVIVMEVIPGGYIIADQNSAGRKTVALEKFIVSGLTKGKMIYYKIKPS